MILFYFCATFGGDLNYVGSSRGKIYSKLLNHSVTWPNVSGMSIPNLLMIQLTLLKWLSNEFDNLWISQQQQIVTLSNDVKFCCASQGLNKFSFWLKAIAASLVQIKKQCWIVKRIFSDSLQKKCPFSNFFFLFRN